MESIWKKTEGSLKRAPLHGNITVDAAVIGGGLAGILIAYFLKSFGMDVILLESNQIGSGQTQNTTAKITIQQSLIYDRLLRQIGFSKASQFAKANQLAVEEYRTIIKRHQIDCDFKSVDSYLYSCEDPERLVKECEAAEKLGIAANLTSETSLPFETTGALKFTNQAIFHPLKFIHFLAKELTIYENTCAQEVRGHHILTNHGTVKADSIIFATHYPLLNKRGLYFMRLYQQRSYLLALKNASPVNGIYLGIDGPKYSFRDYGDILLFGGESHRTGTKSKEDHFLNLKKAAMNFYPSARIETRWSAQDCISLDGIPYIGRITSKIPYQYVATGFNKWGMTGSMISAMLLSDMILGRKNDFEEVFSPQRFFLRASFKEGAAHVGHSIVGLSTGLFSSRPKRCSHMGCRLHKSSSTHTYDCPCHGSRFQYDGRPIDSPAVSSIKPKR